MNKRIPLLFVFLGLLTFAQSKTFPFRSNANFTKIKKVVRHENLNNDLELICKDQNFSPRFISTNLFEAQVVLTANAENSICTSTEKIKWVVLVDLDGNGKNDFEFSSFLPKTDLSLLTDTNNNGIPDIYIEPTENDVTQILPSFTIKERKTLSKVLWKVFDGCGNAIECSSSFTTLDKKVPTPYCVSLFSQFTCEIFAVDFNKGSFDNYTASARSINYTSSLRWLV